ncbi:hypothetical protein [Campylobacter troglodytis]|uniref:hypothetical protein n=1 Tax=Campylobacter troglodytis TaxID=654363 RepID=UPI00115BCB18|nr:hypothetical protein [Campylobacter troglodytis]TQR53136.1 hypothetical protein DMC01_11940 [Campylobacter troglodytis]
MNVSQFIRTINYSSLRTPDIPCFVDEAYGDISETLKLKGMLRLSWSFDIKYNKNIDLIFFPENNPHINYALLYANNFSKSIDESFMPSTLKDINIPYDINYKFTKELLAKANFTQIQQDRFFSSRFGSVFVPLEVEFECYNINMEELSFFKHDIFMGFFGDADFAEFGETIILIGIIKNYSLLSTSVTKLQAYDIAWLKEDDTKIEAKNSITKPLPTSALAYTNTKLNDFVVNLRDRPSTKEGKIIAQLLAQTTISPELYEGSEDIKPIYKAMFDKGYEWYHKDNSDLSPLDEASCYVLYYNFKMLQAYYQANKQKLTNALYRDEYIVLVWEILSNDWCKVWVLKAPKFSIDSFDNKREIIAESYEQGFLTSPSSLKLYEGYIHSSGLEYLCPFTQNYIKS